VAIIFGAGSRVGASLVKRFVGAGYRVATVSRSASPPNSDSGSDKTFHVQADLSDPSAAHGAFAQVTLSAGWPFPSVVVWNAAAMTPPAADDPNNPLAVPAAGFDRDVGLMVKAPYVAAGEAVRAWRGEAGAGAEGARRGTFIMTGNVTPRHIFPVPAMTMLGVGKSGANYWMGVADAALKEEGIR
jgi:NAD(P)-dependent dehydrogenase (short-subunit alcohol dehydrogenase family)